MKKNVLHALVVFWVVAVMLSGCGKDGDGKLEMKEPKKELSEMPPGIVWDASNPDNAKPATK